MGLLTLSKYNSRIGTNWGRSGVPRDVIEEGKKHQVKTISLVKSVEEARDAIANGYALSVCSNYGFSSRRDSTWYSEKEWVMESRNGMGSDGRLS